jgi:hypothetical protein
VDLGETRSWGSLFWSDRYVLQDGAPGEPKRQATVYDTFEDRFVDAPWLNGLVRSVYGNCCYCIPWDRSWLVVTSVGFRDPNKDEPDPVIHYGDGKKLVGGGRRLVFRRSNPRPIFNVGATRDLYVVDRMHLYVDTSGDLLLKSTEEHQFKPETALTNGATFERRTCPGIFERFDPTGPALMRITSSEEPIAVREGDRIDAALILYRWKYLEGTCEAFRIRMDELFEVRGGKLVLGKKQAFPVAE